jgi:hypothetical protein
MRYNFLTLLLTGVMFCFPLRGQQEKFGYCSLPHGWDQISMSRSELPGDAQKILIVTNRPYVEDAPEHEIFPNEVAEYRKVTYLIAACDGEKWQLYRVDDFLSGMKAIDRGGDILLFVHGHGKPMPDVLTRAFQMQDRYDISMVVFDWPSYNSNFNKSLSRVRRCGENFYNLVLQLKEYRAHEMEPDQHLSMILHSLGNYYLTHLVVNGNNQYLKGPVFDNIILNSAAVRSKEHGEVLSQLEMQKRIYVTCNARDKVLRGAHLLTSGKMLGNVVIEPLAPNAIYVDFTCVAGMEHTYFAGYHKFEYDLPAFEHFYFAALHGLTVDFSDETMFHQKSGQPVYVLKNPETGCPE